MHGARPHRSCRHRLKFRVLFFKGGGMGEGFNILKRFLLAGVGEQI